MAFWLLKTEPDSFGWREQVDKGKAGEPWTGVRNHQAKNFLKQMHIGDLAFFYHTGEEKRIVGVVEIIRAAYADPTDSAWIAVDVVACQPLSKPVSLASIKADSRLSSMALVKSSRLSVQPVSTDEWDRVLELSS